MNSNIPLLYRPNHRVSLTLVQETSFSTFQFTSKYTSSQLYEDFLSDDHPIEDNLVIFPLETLPKTFISDLSITKRIAGFDYSLKIKNLFDKDYVLIQHYPMPGRNIEFSLIKPIE